MILKNSCSDKIKRIKTICQNISPYYKKWKINNKKQKTNRIRKKLIEEQEMRN